RLMAPVPSVPIPRRLWPWQHIISAAGWFSKYPLGWPAVLAIPEKLHFGWLVNPLLGTLLLVVMGRIAKQEFGEAVAAPAVLCAVLSPDLLENSVGSMSHGLSGVLVATASLACLRGIRTRSLPYFAAMFAALVLTYQVRPFTATIISATLGIATLVCIR